jgi:hypothetical protein
MTERFCKNCPRLIRDFTEPDIAGKYDVCDLLPEWPTISYPEEHYCYTGRQIMEQEGKETEGGKLR